MKHSLFRRIGAPASIALGVGWAVNVWAGPAESVQFDRVIRPILSDNCFACHGPDANKRKAKLRFDLKEEALNAVRDGKRVIDPGKPESSLLVERITTKDEDDVMPPPKSGKKLSAKQIEQLKQWIAKGAPWERHWAFEPPVRPEPPKVKHANWVRNPIDNFVAARLEKEGLTPSPEADKTTLVRRATLDLTGLPPTPEEVDAFLADNSAGAYEKLVDRLLASPRYGEQQARYWLDAVRYADSHGFHIDAYRSIWKYREWIINAFNSNKPFDQFTIEQLAGDLLPEPTVEQKIATGYLRCNMSTGEGGAIVEEYQAKYTFDRTETTSTIWLGLTMTCARCHSHKFDPISQTEYYRFYAFFNNLEEAVMDGNRPDPAPSIRVPSPEQTERLAWLKEHIDKAQKQLDASDAKADQAQAKWQEDWRKKLRNSFVAPKPASIQARREQPIRTLDDGSVLIAGPQEEQLVHEAVLKLEPGAALQALRLETLPHDSLPKKGSAPADDGVFQLGEIEAELYQPPVNDQPARTVKLKFRTGYADHAADKHPISHALDGELETGWRIDPKAAAAPHSALFLLDKAVNLDRPSELRVRLRYPAKDPKRVIARFRLSASREPSLARLLRPPAFPAWQMIGPFPSEGLESGFAKVYEPEEKIDLKATYQGVRDKIKWQAKGDFQDGKRHLLVNELHGVHGVYYFYRAIKLEEPRRYEFSLYADDLFKMWVNGKLVLQRSDPADAVKGPAKVLVDLPAGESRVLVKVVNHQGAKYFSFDKTLHQPDLLPSDIALALVLHPKLPDSDAKALRRYYRRVFDPKWKALDDQVAEWRAEQDAINRAIPTTMIAKERAERRPTHILLRGEYDKPGDLVEPGVPAILPPFPEGEPTNRLGLARWLVSPDHPLTARVTVNRFWQQFFGTGLVKTAEDFGVQGERPSHPELLDWLATEFVRSGWDVKHMHRLIVTSATYRQSARATPELIARDPENRLLARGPRYRMEAEMIRDTMLAVSGLLVEKLGGPSVKPYEPPGLWEAVSFNNSQKYVPDKGEGQYRRSLYTYWKRQSPPPNMLLFDAPTREYCVVRRPRTNTPLQALDLLNDPQYVEASRALAVRLLQQGGDTVDQRLSFGFRLVTARRPDLGELKILRGTLEAQLKHYREHPEDAQALLKVGSYRAPSDLDPAEVAAWSTVARILLNLDETITKI